MTYRLARSGIAVCIMMLAVVGTLGGYMPSLADSPKGEITVVGWEGFMSEDKDTWIDAIARFNEEYPDITVNSLRISGHASGNYNAKVMTMFAGGIPPDVMWVGPGEVISYQLINDLLKDLRPLIEQSGIPLDEYAHDASVYSIPGDDGIYGLALEFFLHGINYNRDHLDEIGLSTIDSTWDWDEFLTVTKKLTRLDAEGGLGRYAIELEKDMDTGPEVWMWQAGGSVWDETGTELLLDNAATIEGFQFFFDLMHEHRVAPTLEERQLRKDNKTLNFGSGLGVSMYHMRFWNSQSFNWGTVATPKGPGGQFAQYFMRGWAIPQNAANPEAAWAWVAWWMRPENQQLFHDLTERMPPHLPSLSEYIRRDMVGNSRDEWLDTVLYLMPLARHTEVSQYETVLGTFWEELEAAYAGTASVKEVVDRSIGAIRQQLRALKGQ